MDISIQEKLQQLKNDPQWKLVSKHFSINSITNIEFKNDQAIVSFKDSPIQSRKLYFTSYKGLHREDGPAHEVWYNGHLQPYYWLNDNTCSIETFIRSTYPDINWNKVVEWRLEDESQDLYVSVRDDINNKITKFYYRKGKLHREDGPAIIGDGWEEYYLNDRFMVKQEMDHIAEIEKQRLEGKYQALPDNWKDIVIDIEKTNENGLMIVLDNPLSWGEGDNIETLKKQYLFFKDGQLHRERGPAVYWPDEFTEMNPSFYFKGQEIDCEKREYNEQVEFIGQLVKLDQFIESVNNIYPDKIKNLIKIKIDWENVKEVNYISSLNKWSILFKDNSRCNVHSDGCIFWYKNNIEIKQEVIIKQEFIIVNNLINKDIYKDSNLISSELTGKEAILNKISELKLNPVCLENHWDQFDFPSDLDLGSFSSMNIEYDDNGLIKQIMIKDNQGYVFSAHRKSVPTESTDVADNKLEILKIFKQFEIDPEYKNSMTRIELDNESFQISIDSDYDENDNPKARIIPRKIKDKFKGIGINWNDIANATFDSKRNSIHITYLNTDEIVFYNSENGYLIEELYRKQSSINDKIEYLKQYWINPNINWDGIIELHAYYEEDEPVSFEARLKSGEVVESGYKDYNGVLWQKRTPDLVNKEQHPLDGPAVEDHPMWDNLKKESLNKDITLSETKEAATRVGINQASKIIDHTVTQTLSSIDSTAAKSLQQLLASEPGKNLLHFLVGMSLLPQEHPAAQTIGKELRVSGLSNLGNLALDQILKSGIESLPVEEIIHASSTKIAS